MYQKEIEALTEHNLEKLTPLGDSITLEALSASDIHPAIIRFISSELDFMIYKERKILLERSFFDYSDHTVKPYFDKIGQLIKRKKAIPKADVERLIHQAVTLNVSFLLKPNKTLLKFIFNKTEERPVEEVRLLLNYNYFYESIKKIINTVLDIKKKKNLDVVEFQELLEKIKVELLQTKYRYVIDNGLESISNFFTHNEESNAISVGAVEIFLKEKGLKTEIERVKDQISAKSAMLASVEMFKKAIFDGKRTKITQKSAESTQEVTKKPVDIAPPEPDADSFEEPFTDTLQDTTTSEDDLFIKDTQEPEVEEFFEEETISEEFSEELTETPPVSDETEPEQFATESPEEDTQDEREDESPDLSLDEIPLEPESNVDDIFDTSVSEDTGFDFGDSSDVTLDLEPDDTTESAEDIEEPEIIEHDTDDLLDEIPTLDDDAKQEAETVSFEEDDDYSFSDADRFEETDTDDEKTTDSTEDVLDDLLNNDRDTDSSDEDTLDLDLDDSSLLDLDLDDNHTDFEEFLDSTDSTDDEIEDFVDSDKTLDKKESSNKDELKLPDESEFEDDFLNYENFGDFLKSEMHDKIDTKDESPDKQEDEFSDFSGLDDSVEPMQIDDDFLDSSDEPTEIDDTYLDSLEDSPELEEIDDSFLDSLTSKESSPKKDSAIEEQIDTSDFEGFEDFDSIEELDSNSDLNDLDMLEDIELDAPVPKKDDGKKIDYVFEEYLDDESNDYNVKVQKTKDSVRNEETDKFLNLLSEKDTDKIVSGLFNEDFNDLETVIEKIVECTSIHEAEYIVESTVKKADVNPKSKPVKILNKKVAEYFKKHRK